MLKKRPRLSTAAADPSRLPGTERRSLAFEPSRAFLVSTSAIAQSRQQEYFKSEDQESSPLSQDPRPESTRHCAGTGDPYFCQGSTSNQADSSTITEWHPSPATSIQGSSKPHAPPESGDSETISCNDDETMTFVSDARTVTYRESLATESSPGPKMKESRGQLVGDGSAPNLFEEPVPPQPIFKVPAVVEKKAEKQGPKTLKRKDDMVWHSVDSRDFNQVHFQRESAFSCRNTDFMYESKITFQTQALAVQPTHVDSRSLTTQTKDPRSPNKGFVRFSSCVRRHYQSLNPNMSNKDVMTTIANAWRALDQSEKDYFRHPSYTNQLRFFDMSSQMSKLSK